jgi:hypothetical protein
MFTTIDIEEVRDGGLERQTWRFRLKDMPSKFVFSLAIYFHDERETRRHKWQHVEAFSIYEQRKYELEMIAVPSQSVPLPKRVTEKLRNKILEMIEIEGEEK